MHVSGRWNLSTPNLADEAIPEEAAHKTTECSTGFSRARRTIDNFFGIFAARLRIFRRPIRADELTVEKIVKAAVCVHNYLLYTDNASYMPQGFVDSYNADGTIVNGSWRQDVQPLAAIPQQGSTNYTITAKQTRYSLCKLFQTFCFRLY